MKTLYYAHSKRIYGSRQERRELKLIKRKFPNHKIINPALINWKELIESEIMGECKKTVKEVDVIVVSEYLNHIGRGVTEELATAIEVGVEKYLIRKKKKFIAKFTVKLINPNDWAIRYAKCVEAVK